MGFVSVHIAQFNQAGFPPLELQMNNIQLLESSLLETFSNFSANLFCQSSVATEDQHCLNQALTSIRDIKRAYFYSQVSVVFYSPITTPILELTICLR